MMLGYYNTCILENLETNKFIFQVLEMSWNLTKSENVPEKILPFTWNKIARE